jgi:diguanylate cyclase (GGDEF)-like protein
VLDLAHAQVSRHRPVALVWLDVDLQGVNAALGHARGDELLVQVARRLLAVGGKDAVGRIGSQEFALVLRSGPDGLEVAESVASVLAGLAEPFPLSGVDPLRDHPRQGLGLCVVAEGVENEQIHAALRQLGCDLAQGYHLDGPIPIADIPAWLVSPSASGR